ncbi:MAG: diacylglycerol kinase [Litorilinea sp.]|nr:MAG: diacylglycerol kinase [Litorilinea sp.]
MSRGPDKEDAPVSAMNAEKALQRRIAVIINPAAGKPQPVLHILNQIFRQAGIQWDALVTHGAGDASQHARRAMEMGVDLIAACGGDGTVMEVGRALLGTGVPLAILPAGTGNALAVELGIPVALERAASLLCMPRLSIRTIDVGISQDLQGARPFFLRLATGLVAEIGAGTPQSLKSRFGKLAYPLSVWQWLHQQQPAHYQVDVDGKSHRVEGVACLVLNSGGIGLPGIRLSSRIQISDGVLDVLILNHANVGAMLDVLTGAIQGDFPGGEILHWQGTSIHIEARPPQPVTLDGEAAGQTPVAVQVSKQGLPVVVPPADWMQDEG